MNFPFNSWPIAATSHETLWLTKSGHLSKEAPLSAETLSYQSDVRALQVDSDSEELLFEYTFPRKACILGCSRAFLEMSCQDSDDMDVFVQLRKADKNGHILQNVNIPFRAVGKHAEAIESTNPLKYLGPTGALRASHRAIDSKLSTQFWPEHDYTSRNPVKRGEMVTMDIGIWQTGIVFDAGEKLVLKVSGHNMTLAEFTALRGQLSASNVGQHVLHIGGMHPSRLVIPLVEVEGIM